MSWGRRLLRYNSAHRLWFPRGYRGRWLPLLDPTESSSHGKNHKRTFSWNEPVWLFRLRQRLFCFAGRHRCPDRGALSALPAPVPQPDTWDIGPDSNRTCSFCGSIHPDDLMAICRKTLADERYGVEGTTKSYKVYVRQPGVSNAGQGAIKFYMHHAPEKPAAADQALFAKAMKVTRDRWLAQSVRPAAEG